MTDLSAAPPLEVPRHPVGHRSSRSLDTSRGARELGLDIWYPAAEIRDGAAGHDAGHDAVTRYELIPGVEFTSATARESVPVRDARHPLIVWSHGRTGMRHNYTLLCEALAGRGYVVISPDHPGDGLFDWLSGTQVDDATNERQRLGDVRHCLDLVLGRPGHDTGARPLDWLAGAVDAEAVAVGGHSYGGLTAMATIGSLHESRPDPRARAAVAAQGYTRTLPHDFFDSIDAPVLMIVGDRDVTTPPDTDAEPAWSAISSRGDEVGRLSRRHDLPGAGHQGCSDFGLYAELAPRVPGLPQIVVDYLGSIAAEAPDDWRSSWRNDLRSHIEWIDDFLCSLGIGPAGAGVARGPATDR